MPRNKYPEETEQKIIEKALELFTSKGYESTSVQDIIDATGLSKGAIYHHFDSKESILLTVYERIFGKAWQEMMKIVESKEMNGREKLQAIFLHSYQDKEQVDFMISMPDLLDNPQFLALYLKESVYKIAPKCIYPVLQEGIEDGSIKCKYPMETAQALIALYNVWMNPLIYHHSGELPENKTAVLQQILLGLGIEMDDFGMEEQMREVMKKHIEEQV